MMRTYKIIFHNKFDEPLTEIIIDADRLPSHLEIMDLVNEVLPDREAGGWYSMESEAPAEGPEMLSHGVEEK